MRSGKQRGTTDQKIEEGSKTKQNYEKAFSPNVYLQRAAFAAFVIAD